MSAKLERAFALLEKLADHPEGCSLSYLSTELQLPLSATHRLLTELCECGYARQRRGYSEYAMTIKLVSLGLHYLGNSGVVDVAQPLLDELAQSCQELVRLAVVDGEELVFVARAQGAKRGLRYDPDMGLSVNLACSAAGHALLSTMTDDEALERVARQGLGNASDFGPKAPKTARAVLTYVRAARKLGFSRITEVFAPGMASLAAPVRGPDGRAIGVVTIAGPSVRLSDERMMALGPTLRDTAAQVSAASRASAMFKPRGLGSEVQVGD